MTTSADWGSVDWSLSNQEIANLKGRSVIRVNAMRKAHAPGTVREHSLRNRVKWEEIDWSKPISQIARETNCIYNYVALRRHHFVSDIRQSHTKLPKGFWDNLDWSKTDTALSKQSKLPFYRVRSERLKREIAKLKSELEVYKRLSKSCSKH